MNNADLIVSYGRKIAKRRNNGQWQAEIKIAKRASTRLEYVLMKLAPTIYLFALILVGQIFVACNGSGNQNDDSANSISSRTANSQILGENANSIKDNVEELELIIKLPAHPEEVIWREDKTNVQSSASTPSGKKLTAVLKFTAEDADKIAAQSETYRPAKPAQIDTESWFPAELIAQSELSGDETLKGDAYAANDFLQPPFSDGKLTRLENSNYFILELLAE